REWIGVGLEWYSGDDLPIIKRLPPDLFPKYKTEVMQPKYLVPNAVKGWLMVRYSNRAEGGALVDQMLFMGKVLYITQALLSDLGVDDLMNYSESEMEW